MVRYVIFAILATFANLFVQRLVLSFSDTTKFFLLAIAAGTLIGLFVKYFLDKRWIFYDRSSGIMNHGHKFFLYTVMGILTTGVFWGLETIFWFIWKTNLMRELGAILGLSIGYVVKFNLDRRFVFSGSKVGGVV